MYHISFIYLIMCMHLVKKLKVERKKEKQTAITVIFFFYILWLHTLWSSHKRDWTCALYTCNLQMHHPGSNLYFFLPGDSFSEAASAKKMDPLQSVKGLFVRSQEPLSVFFPPLISVSVSKQRWENANIKSIEGYSIESIEQCKQILILI